MMTHEQSLAARLCKAPRPADLRAARAKLADLLEHEEIRTQLAEQPALRALLLGVVDHSSFLWRLMRQDPSRLAALLSQAPESAFQKILSTLHGDCAAATSVGIIGGVPMLDLAYEEDSKADVDMNVVMTDQGKFIEIQGTAEGEAFSKEEMRKNKKGG